MSLKLSRLSVVVCIAMTAILSGCGDTHRPRSGPNPNHVPYMNSIGSTDEAGPPEPVARGSFVELSSTLDPGAEFSLKPQEIQAAVKNAVFVEVPEAQVCLMILSFKNNESQKSDSRDKRGYGKNATGYGVGHGYGFGHGYMSAVTADLNICRKMSYTGGG